MQFYIKKKSMEQTYSFQETLENPEHEKEAESRLA
jgi:hypothetical protein